MGCDKNIDRSSECPKMRRSVLLWIAAIVVGSICYFASGFYFVQPDERAVVRRFGKIVDKQAQPGLHYAWPTPIGRVDKPRTTEIKRVTVGIPPAMKAAIAAGDIVARGESDETDVFTGDVNIVKATMVATYQITEVDKYITKTVNADLLVELAVQSVMIETLGGHSIDDALAQGKADIQNTTALRAQDMLDAYDSGITLVAVNIESIEPPYAINDAFRDVASAKKDRERTIDEARAFANSILPKAAATAYGIEEEAKSYAEEVRRRAIGETDRFLAVQAQYAENPAVTRNRLLLSTFTFVMEQAEVFVYTPNQNGPPLRITVMDRNEP